MEEEVKFNNFQIGEQVDCKDTVDKWLNAEIIAKREEELRVHYTQWSQKYDEWIHLKDNRILKQWSPGQPIQINNRLDVRYVDQNNSQWLEAIVIKFDDHDSNKIYIHFIDYKKKYDQWVDITDSQRVAEVGMHSKAHGRASLQKTNPKFQEIQKKFIQMLKNKEKSFREQIKDTNNWVVHEVESDGNCLFRSVSHQIYGVEDFHNEIRQICMDYLVINKDYFQNFIIGGGKSFEDYVSWKRQDAVWGDNVEIQAIREIYKRPVEIYAYSNQPMRTFSENSDDNQRFPIRLSYHGQSHYNSIVMEPGVVDQPEDDMEQPAVADNPWAGLEQENFGKIEQYSLDSAKHRIQNKQENQNENNHVDQARKDFEKIGNRDMDEAIKESFNVFQEKTKQEENKLIENALTNDAINQVDKFLEKETDDKIKQSQEEYEQQQLKIAAEQSRKEQEQLEQQQIQEKLYEEDLKNAQLKSNQEYNDQLNQVLMDSLNQYNYNPLQQFQNNQNQNVVINQNVHNNNSNQRNFILVGDPMDNITILQVLNNDLNMDISLNEAIWAYEKFGENSQEIIAYFCENKL